MLAKLKQYARQLKQELYVLYFSYKDVRTPWYAKVVAICVVAYAFSPIDLIPDFIPILGYLDDLVLIPLGISLALKMIPPQVLHDNRAKAEELRQMGKPKNWFVGTFFILIWIALAAWVGYMLVDFSGIGVISS